MTDKITWALLKMELVENEDTREQSWNSIKVDEWDHDPLEAIREVYDKYKDVRISAFDPLFKDFLEGQRFDMWQAIKKAMEGK